jgi:putative acetyltransferase
MNRLRQAVPQDASAIALLHRKVMKAALPYLPDLHTAEEDQSFFAEYFLPQNEVWVWEDDGIVGYCGFQDDWLNHLYVDLARHRQGIGSALLNVAKAKSDQLNLWAFQRNVAAIAFYERNGFVLAETTDGQGNEEKEPDARYVWRKRLT